MSLFLYVFFSGCFVVVVVLFFLPLQHPGLSRAFDSRIWLLQVERWGVLDSSSWGAVHKTFLDTSFFFNITLTHSKLWNELLIPRQCARATCVTCSLFCKLYFWFCGKESKTGTSLTANILPSKGENSLSLPTAFCWCSNRRKYDS